MKKFNNYSKAFTMLELVFVIVVLGILAALALPRMDRDLRQEAKDNLLSAIRYTQHLALKDDKTDPMDPNWQKELWQIRFSSSANNLENFYTISSDSNHDGTVDNTETAIDPANGNYMFTDDSIIDSDESPNIFIGKTYGINSMNFSDGCTGTDHIAFDHFGRPHTGIETATNTYSTYMSTNCNIVIGFEDTSIRDMNITIATETGYVTID